jgi:hypothetical protein
MSETLVTSSVQEPQKKNKKPNSFRSASIDEFLVQTEQLYNEDPVKVRKNVQQICLLACE